MNIRELALKEYADHIDAQQTLAKERAERDAQERGDMLHRMMQKVFGDGVFDTGIEDGYPYAILSDIPNARFFAQYRGNDYLRMQPVLNIPMEDAYDEYYNNKLNANRPTDTTIRTLREVGHVLTQWEAADWTIYPWPEKQPKNATAKRFDVLTLTQVNEETRQFKVIHVYNDDGYACFVVEYQD